MTVRLFDGNNVMRRQVEKHGLMPGQLPMSLRMRYEQTLPTDIWVWDGLRHNERRQIVYPPYKANREPIAEDIFSQVKLWKDVLKLSAATQITVHGWEADDVIGTLVRKRPGIFTVHTNDMDYGQVAHLCHLNGVNMKGVPCRWIALYKAMVGDTSDNIKGIPGFGPGRWAGMEKHWQEIEAAIVAGDPRNFVGLPFKPAVAAWLAVDENIALLQAMLTVTHFCNVPDDELEGGITRGKWSPNEAHALLSEFFL